MTQYFGPKPWGPAERGDCPYVETPVGWKCLWCEEEIGPEDSGVVMPYLQHFDKETGKATGRMAAQHRECWLRQLFGSVGHQMHRCSCYHGDEEDPVGMTVREAAHAAAELFEKVRMTRPADA